MKLFRKIFIRPRSLLILFIVVVVIIGISIVTELIQSRQEVLELMQNQSHSLLETMIVSSKEVLYTSNSIEDEINKRMLNNAAVVKLLYEQNKISDKLLKQIAEENDIVRINIFNRKAEMIYSNISSGLSSDSKRTAREFLSPIFNGVEDTVIVGIREAKYTDGFRYIIAISTDSNGAIVINLDAEEIMSIRRSTGFGILLNKLTDNKGVIYTALQSETGLLAASQNIWQLDDSGKNDFLNSFIEDTTFTWRITNAAGEEVFEALHPFTIESENIGMFRIGLSLEPLNAVSARSTNRIIISGIVLIVLGTVLLVLVFARQDLAVVKKEYDYLEGFSQKLIESTNDAILVLDGSKTIKEINRAGLELLGKDKKDLMGKDISNFICHENSAEILESESDIQEVKCDINGNSRTLLLSKSKIEYRDKEDDIVLVIKDMTELKEMEKQVARSEQLFAMAHLASGVAHEIRNPLNTIGTIAQQLDRDFEPQEEQEQYHSLAKVVYKEVRRINRTIQNFLKFAKPQPLTFSEFELEELLKEIEIQYSSLLQNLGIDFNIDIIWNGKVNWDKDQIKQVLMNLIENAKDAVKESGKISLIVQLVNEKVVIEIQDTGKGIGEEELNKIFNLYFTTKAEGTGLGLSIVQRIVNEHDGIMLVESKVRAGTKFTIKISPTRV